MKRILPILIIICLLGAVFICLPQSGEKRIVLNSLDDVNGCTVGVQGGTNYEDVLMEACPNAIPVFYEEFATMFPALRQGKIDAMLTESVSFTVEKWENPTLVAVEESLMTMETAIGVPKTKQGNILLEQLNEYLAEINRDGTMEAMMDYWFYHYDRNHIVVDKSGITGENGVIVFGAEAAFEPACFAGAGGELLGFDVEFIYGFCRAYGYEPRIETLEYTAMVSALAGGRINAAVGVLPDEERAEEISFSDTFFPFSLLVVYDSGEGDTGTFFENLSASFHKTFIRDDRWQMFMEGAGTTLLIAALSVVFGTVLGLLLYQWCAHGKKFENKVTGVLCWLMSSTPTIVLLMVLYYILFAGYVISNLAVAVIGFTLLFGCGFYELIVSGVKAVGKGQAEAARAQGFSQDQTFFRILLPQAAEHFMPAYEGAVISLIQETSVVGYIAVMDLTKMSDLVRGRTYEAFFPLLATAGIYFLLIWLLTTAIRYLSKGIHTKNRKQKRILKHITASEKE